MKSDNNPESLNKALDLAVESGASEESVEYFMATQLFTKDMNREIFFKFTTAESTTCRSVDTRTIAEALIRGLPIKS